MSTAAIEHGDGITTDGFTIDGFTNDCCNTNKASHRERPFYTLEVRNL